MKVGIASYCLFVVLELLAVSGVLWLYDMQWSWIIMPLVLLVAVIPAVAMGTVASEHKRGDDNLKKEDLK